jgi:hypothetical protein
MELATRDPVSEAEMLEVKGVGPTKFAKYGQHFLALLLRHRSQK